MVSEQNDNENGKNNDAGFKTHIFCKPLNDVNGKPSEKNENDQIYKPRQQSAGKRSRRKFQFNIKVRHDAQHRHRSNVLPVS